MLWRNLKAKCSLSVKYPYISVFSLKAYYEQNPEVKKDVSRLIDKENQMGRQEFLESMDHSLFREEIDLKMMVQEVTLACEGYLYPLGHTASHTLRVGVLRTIRYTHRASRISYPTGGRATHDKVYRRYHEGQLDFGQVEKDFKNLIAHWKSIYRKR